ncbi:MAG TPA: hypothetical protein VMT34_15065 [Aggregatilineales bacterium]|nr:hypothetical protein [Aggregatilineales bacterium]
MFSAWKIAAETGIDLNQDEVQAAIDELLGDLSENDPENVASGYPTE